MKTYGFYVILTTTDKTPRNYVKSVTMQAQALS